MLFPERQIYIRSGGDARYFSLKTTVQVAAVSGLALAFAGTAVTFLLVGHKSSQQWLGADIVRLEAKLSNEVVAAQQAITENSADFEQQIEILSARLESSRTTIQTERQDAQNRLEALSTNLANATSQLEDAASKSFKEQERISSLEQQIAAVQADEKKAVERLSSIDEGQLSELRGKREALQKRLAIELKENDDLRKRFAQQILMLQSEVAQIRGARDDLSAQLDQADTARSKAETEVEQLTQRLSKLQSNMATQKSETHALETELSSIMKELSTAQLQQRAAKEAANTPEQSADSQKQSTLEKRVADLLVIEDSLIAQLEKSAAHDLAFVERVIRQTGLDVDMLMDSLDSDSPAIGGPFLDLSDMQKVTEKTPSRPDVSDRVHNLNYQLSKLSWLEIALKSIPLATPTDQGRMTSGFGGRKDPFTRKSAFHSGLDFAGVRGSEVRATGPGVVEFAGRRSSYGNFIEINHGHGIRTRYAHLSALNVETGDKVDFLQNIGAMGSSGRSTGVHLHYEVVFNGDFLDPKQFIEAGRDVFKVKTQFAKPTQKASSGR